MEILDLMSMINNFSRKTPGKTAIECGGEHISYLTLYEYSNQIADFLSRHIFETKNILVMMDKGIDLVKAILGIIKSNNIFVPVDINYPEKRIELMLDEVQSDWIITQSSFVPKLSNIVRQGERKVNILVLDKETQAIDGIENLMLYRIDENTGKEYTLEKSEKNKHCYIYFTSGSTGKPKGIMGRYKSLCHFIQWEIEEFEVNDSFRVSQFTSPSFDPFLRDIFVPLCAGGTLCIPQNNEIIMDPEKMSEWIEENRITLIHMVPTLFKGLARVLKDTHGIMHLKYILLAGELLRGRDIKQFTELYGSRIQLVNLYGPTETTLAKLYYRIQESDVEKISIPVGKPITFTEAMILDKDLNRCVVNGIGEIYIRTPFITSGYLNNRELNKKVFIKNPFNENLQDIIYKTGDLGRLLPDGNIEIIGRIDHQVKIRGYRIELGEIENSLLGYEGVTEAVAMAVENETGNKNLCAYIAGNKEIDVADLRAYLSKALPEYMIPSHFVSLEKLPLTQNGKIDRKALAEAGHMMSSKTAYMAAENETEAKLVEIWQRVLGVQRVGINDNFFELGGHSLNATSMVSGVHKELSVEVPLKEVFNTPTIKGLAEYIQNIERNNYVRIEPAGKMEYYKLSSAQKRIFALQAMDKESTAYNIPQVVELAGELNKHKLHNAFAELIRRHEGLRTGFEVKGEEIFQKIQEEVAFSLEHYEAGDDAELEKLADDFFRPFDLSRAPLMRAGIIELAEVRHILMIDVHHIISDGTSTAILVKEFGELYNGKVLPELRIQYKDYVPWQQNRLQKDSLKKQEAYWLKEYEEIPVLNLPTDYARPKMQSFEGDKIQLKLSKTLTNGIRRIAKETGSTLYMVLLTAFNILLSKYSGQEDIVVGSPIAGRYHADLENIMGMFINTLAMRNYPEGRKTFRKFLEEVKGKALAAYENQEYQFEELVEKANVRRDISRNPIFDVMLILQNMEVGEVKLEGLTLKPFKTENKISKFDLMVTAYESEEELPLKIEYCTSLFRKETIEKMGRHLVNILEKAVEKPDIKLEEMDMTGEEERKQLLYEFNATKAAYPENKTIQRLFEEQAEKTPDNIAVIYEEQQLTYRELSGKANQLARVLREKGIGPDDIVGILVKRSLEMVIGMMGILKAGGAYLPIDPEYPEDRIRYMLEDSGARILLTQKELNDNSGCEIEKIMLDEAGLFKGETQILSEVSSASHMAYVIYTSGSTGKPKGVMIEHRSVINFIKGMTAIDFSESYSILCLTSVSFDIMGLETLLPLSMGMKIVIADEEAQRDAKKLSQIIEKEKIDTLQLTPSRMQMMLENEEFRSSIGRLDIIMIGGEALPGALLKEVQSIAKARIYNMYGPTETTIYSTIKEVTKEEKVTIGKPIANTKIYILGKNNQIQPVNVPGELCIAGVGLARGYLNNPTLTEEKFVPNPFATGERIYKTGDLARWLPDGNIEFLGRVDHQVKIRGYRIELGEIESRLIEHEAVKEAAVRAWEDENADKYLCAYITPEVKESKLTGTSQLREYLMKVLPEYMVPSYFVELDKLPLTTSGKVDRKALPKPDGSIVTGREYEAPGNELEEKLVSIWQEVLKVEQVGINDSFFELGGHSLKATVMAARIHKELQLEIPLREIFIAPTVKGLAEYAKRQIKSIYETIKPAEESASGYYPASSAQKRLYALFQMETDSIGYNIPVILEVEGDLRREKLQKAFKNLISRHEAFRTDFEFIGEEILQRVHKDVEFEIVYNEENEAEAKERIKRFIRPFNLNHAPLIRVGLIRILQGNETAIKKHIIAVDMHHIISDGTSMGILVKEFAELYEGKELPELKLQYRDYASWQNQMLQGDVLRKQEAYWLGEYGDNEGVSKEIPVLNLPTDYTRPGLQSFEGDRIQFELNEDMAKALSRMAKRAGATMYMVLLAGFNILLSKYSGQEDIIVGTPIAGRHHADLENIIGIFVNTLAMRNYPEGRKTFKGFLQEVKEKALKAYENQDYQFEALVEKVNVERDLSRNPLFDVMFAMQNIDMGLANMEGLQIRQYKIENIISKFDLSLTAVEAGEKIQLEMEYCTKLYKKETIEQMALHFTSILAKVTENEDAKLDEIEIINEKEKHRLLYEFNDTYAEYPRDKTIHQIFQEQKAKTPDNIAVKYGDKKLTYSELNKAANQLARLLREKGVNRESIVGIMAESSIDLIVGILGILKAGGAYLPIDPDYPADRISYMLEDCGSTVLLTQTHVSGRISFGGASIMLDDAGNYTGSGDNLEIINKQRDLAYIIYTSGSTGQPKGVMIEHRSLVNQVSGLIEDFGYGKMTNHMLYAKPIFDVSVQHIFTALGCGAALHLMTDEMKTDYHVLYDYVRKNKIQFIDMVPAQMETLVEYLGDDCTDIRIVLGGEAFPVSLYKKIINQVKPEGIYNVYGPTETTINALIHQCREDEHGKVIPIGKPVRNYQAYILDKCDHLQPIGVPGELCISGDGLARGYLNRNYLTAERFVDNPIKPGTKMYRTGDLARWLTDGTVEFLGRMDHQVKIRGYRIELGEIENKLLGHAGIKEAVVVVREDNSGYKKLCAFIVGEKEPAAALNPAKLREYLSKELPDYMVPVYYVHMDEIPLTPNGKVDRKALTESKKWPELDSSTMAGSEYGAPRNEIEEKVALVWQEVLKIEKIGIKDNFFALGGDSIKAIQVSARIQKYGYKLQIRDLLKNPTIEELSKFVETGSPSAEQGIVEGEAALLPIQRWFFEQQFEEKHHSNQAVMLYSKDGFNESIIRQVFTKIMEYHDILRSVYKEEDGRIIQKIRGIEENLFTLDVYDLKAEKAYAARIEEEAGKLQGSIDLEMGPLVKLGLFKTNEGDNLLITIHHLVIDGVSWRILFEDMAEGYRKVQEGKKIVLPAKTASYKAWANTLMEYASGEEMEKELEHWRKIETNEIAPLIKENNVSVSKVGNNRIARVELTEEETEKLQREVNRAYNTEINDILLTALGVAVSKWTGEEKVAVNLEGHGREEIGKIDITRTVGWFTAMYPVVMDMSYKDMGYQIKVVKETLREIPNKGIGYGILKYLVLPENRKGVELALKPEISFNYLGQFDEDVEPSVFEISELSFGASVSGEAKNVHAIDINGMLARGKLGFNISYDGYEYSEETIGKLAEGYHRALTDIIEYCVNKEEAELTPSDISTGKLNIDELEALYETLGEINGAYRKGNIKDIYSLTPMQEGMLFHSILDKESTAYFEQTILQVEGEIDIELYEESLNLIIERHDALRTVFVYEKVKNPVQAVMEERKSRVYYEDISEIREEERAAKLEYIKEADKKKGFDLTQNTLIRLSVVKIGKESYEVIWSFHHIVMDGWCMGIIMNEFAKIYHSLRNKKAIELPAAYPYSRFIRWMEKQDREKACEYWRSYMKGYEEQAIVPKKRGYSGQGGYRTEELVFFIEETLTERIKKIAGDNRVTMNSIFLGVWGMVLQKYNGREDVVFGAVVSGRPAELTGIEHMLGLFINTVPVRISANKDESFSGLIKRIQESATDMREYEYSTLAEIQSETELKQNLIDHIMAFESYPVEEEIGKSTDDSTLGFTIKGIKFYEQTNYDFNIAVIPGKELKIRIIYNGEAYDSNFIENTARHIKNIIKQVAANPGARIGEIDILEKDERQKLLYAYNDTNSEYLRDKTIHQLFEEQAEKTPESIAAIYEGRELTYKELNEEANRLAWQLKSRGAGPLSIVAILVERSLDMLTGVIAVLKAGATYLPFETNVPKNRMAKILEDLKVEHIISQPEYLKFIQEIQWESDMLCNIYCVDEAGEKPGSYKADWNQAVNLWDHISETAYDAVTAGGFFSAYTGRPFIPEEVNEYKQHILKLAKPYTGKDKQVLEIGCGSGTIMFELAAMSGGYVGLDPSKETQKRNENYITEKQISNIRLVEGFAHDIGTLEPEAYDLIIMASTVQFFPDMAYLEKVIESCMRLLKPEGTILIADIPDLKQRESYRRSVEEYYNSSEEKDLLNPKKDFYSELYVSPEYFADLANEASLNMAADIIKRSEGFKNELKFRYDVTLKKNNRTEKLNVRDRRRNIWTEWHIKRQSHENLNLKLKSDSVAYIIYTSGSTGTPKGVVIQHFPVINVIEWMNKTFEIGSKDKVLFITSICFDLSVYDIFGILAAGGTVRIASRSELQSPDELVGIMCSEGITIWDSAPAGLQQLTNYFGKYRNEAEESRLRLVFLSGDWIPVKLPDLVRSTFKQAEIVSLGGATEATIWSNYYRIREVEPDWPSIPYGKPIQNAKYYILGEYLEPSPEGVEGDLYIGGECLAAGYANNPELTSERFIPNPFVPGEKMYMTGDRARWLADGNMEFLGRSDNQVKIRGYRIELGEIENRLLSYAGIKEALVTAKEDFEKNKYLCAYIAGEGELKPAELREYLSRQLPDYMQPTYFVRIDKLPLTPNGKIDRNALPEPDTNIMAATEYEAPRNETEEKLAQIFEEVLMIDKVGINDNFFEIGGHSLRATSLAGRIHKELNAEVPLREIFKTPTIKGLSEYIRGLDKNIYEAIQPVKVPDSYPEGCYKLSSAQKRMYALQQFDAEGTGYNISGVWEVLGTLDIGKLKEAFAKLIKRHEPLRTSFELVGEEIVQRIHEDVEFGIEYSKAEADNDGCKEIVRGFIRAFDLAAAPLIRVGVIELSSGRYLLMYDMHHIISDGISMGILIKEFAELYEGKELPGLRIQYKDYAALQNKMKESGALGKQEAYWLKQYEGEIPVLSLPTDYPRPVIQSFEGDSINFVLNVELADGLRKIAKETGTTMYMVLLSGFNILLSKYSGQEDIVVGSPIAGRPHADLSNIIGIFINTLAIRSYPEGDKTFREFLGEVRENTIKAYENQDYQFEELVDKLKLTRDLGRNPLFDVMLTLQNLETHEADLGEIEIRPYNAETRTSKFDMTVTAIELGAEIKLNITYCTKLFSRDTIESLYKHLENIIHIATSDPDIKLSDIEMITKEEKYQLLEAFNDTEKEYPKDKTIHELFEEQAVLTPENVAVVYEAKASGRKELTYRALNEKANQLARVLRGRGIKPGSIAGIMAERSIEMIVGIMAILKAGGAYLPIDPEYPGDRIHYMLEDSGAKLLLTHSRLMGKYMPDIDMLVMDDDNLYAGDKSNLENSSKSTDLIYVIYTSGTTGKPKGVMLQNYNLVNYVSWFTGKAGINSMDKGLLVSSAAFDLGYTTLYSSILQGAELHIAAKEIVTDPEALLKYINDKNITYLKLTPSLYNTICNCESFLQGSMLNSLRLIVLGGEPINAMDVENTYRLYNNIRVMNHYGPTETAVGTAACIIDRKQLETFKNKPVIGRPISNSNIYILDKYLKPTAVGVPGELCISGEGLSKGYLNRPELTAEKFVENPFENSERMYKTGDLARWLRDGNIEFIGRIDHQVKIRGFRIELGEIESKLLCHTAIKEAIVMAKEDANGNKYICAYVVFRDGPGKEALSTAKLREYLAGELPDYMIPSYFIAMDKLPLTPNGKLDRTALPEPDGSREAGSEYEAPRNSIEEKLVKIWQEVLGIESVGINDSFFALGGDSIKAIQASARLQRYQLKLEVKYVLQNLSIKELCKYVSHKNRKAEQGLITGEIGLTPVQKHFFAQYTKDRHYYNQSVMLYKKDGFDQQVLVKAFDKIVEHHDILRAVYEEKADIIQVNRDKSGELYTLNLFDLRDTVKYKKEIEAAADNIQNSINLSTGPIMKLGLFKTNQGDHLLIVIHHLVIDGVSWRILFEDLAIAYNQALKAENIVLQNKTDSFKIWSEALEKYADSRKLFKEIDYWKKVCETDILPLPKNEQSSGNRIKDMGSISVKLTEEETEKLLKQVNRAYNTQMNDILLTAFGMALKEWTGFDKVLIDLEGHGRDAKLGDVDITRTVGWFTSIYPVVLDMTGSKDILFQIKKTKELLRHIPNKGVGHGILKYIASQDYKQGISFDDKAEICFNYLGQFDNDVKTDVFSVSEISSGNSMSQDIERAYSLDVSGMIAGGILGLGISYNKNKYSEETIKKLAESYRNNLADIIEHCAAKEEAELTPSDTTAGNIDLEEFELLVNMLKESGIEKNRIQDVYSLSPMQEGLLFHLLSDQSSPMYFEQMTFAIEGKLDLTLFEKSLKNIVEKYDVLRTVFVYERLKKPVQVVLKAADAQIYFEDIAGMEEADKAVFLEEYKEKDKSKGFSLEKETPFRITVIKEGEDKYRLIWSSHHIIMDGWCRGIVINDFFRNYIAKMQGRNLETGRTKPYGSFIGWLEEQDKKEAISYWRNYLEEYENKAVIPYEENKARAEKYAKEELSFTFGEVLTKRLEKYARNTGATLNTLFQAMWGVLLQRYNGTEDVVFGAVVAGRPAELEDIEEMVGLFINTIPVRVRSAQEESFAAVVKELQREAIEANKHDYVPLSEVQSNSVLKQNLIDHIIIFENYPIEKEVEEISINNRLGFEIKEVQVFEQTNYNFNITVNPGKELAVKFAYNAEVYDKAQIRKIEGHLKKIAEAITAYPAVKIGEIEILTEEESYQILGSFNNTKAEYPKDKLIHEMFEEQAERTPDNVAVLYDDKKLTYRELNEKANRLARVLREKGIVPDSIVGIMVERSLEMLVGIMGILKAGGAYLPIDVEYPKDRTEYILKDSGAKILLVKKYLKDEITFDGEVICIEDLELSDYEGSNPKRINKSTDLAYVIYTSGSTGLPKGAMIEHHSVINRLNWMQKAYPLTEADIILQKTTYTFDVSVWELFWWSFKGASVCLLPYKGEKDPEVILNCIEKNKITTMHFVPSMFNVFLQYIEQQKSAHRLYSLKQIFCSGEALSPKQAALFGQLTKAVGKIKLINLYGPTEATVDVSGYECLTEKQTEIIPIGKPIDNINLYILDRYDKLQPVGVAGELHISGAGLARGYLNKPGLTKEKFVENPYVKGERMYRTGDLARWLPDGNVEYLGRIDHQVKIRGFRIELGEIENVIKKQEGVKEALVLVRGESSENRYLCAYLVLDNADVQTIKTELVKKLPDYMLPASYIIIDSIPLTANGKVDRKALQGMQTSDGTRNKIPPRNYHDNTIAQIWKDILNIDEVYIDEDFFDMGGNSINIIQVANRIKEALEIEISLADLMIYKTIRELSEYLTDKDRSSRGKFRNAFKINKSKSEKNIFIVHGGDADIFYYRHLAKLLEDEYSVYGLQPTGLSGEEAFPDSYYNMLHDYIKEIRMIQSEGPYIIAGYCIGGYISFDITTAFEVQGEKVAALLQLDQEAFIEERWVKLVKKNYMRFCLIDLWRRISKKDKMYTLEKFADLFPKAKPLSKERQLEILKDRKSLQQYFQRELSTSTRYSFVGPTVKTPTLVVKAEENNHPLLKKELWEKMARGPLEYYEIPGGHKTVLLPPYVEKMAGIVREYLHKRLK